MKIEEVFTLSSYEKGSHVVDGNRPKNPSFRESITPLDRMIEAFSRYPTGTKIRVRMDTVVATKRHKNDKVRYVRFDVVEV